MRACDCGQPGMPQEVFEYAIEQSHAVYVKYPDGLQRERECDDQSFYFRNGRVGAFSG